MLEPLEDKALKAWIAEGDSMREMVALGFMTENLAQNTTTWFELPNVAEAQVNSDDGVADTRGEFFVDGEAIQRVLEIAQAQGLDGLTRVLWHTHVNTQEPSAEDIAEFPEWLAHVGMIYHVPTNTVTLYNESGVISPLMDNGAAGLATTES
jgi:hypothetical protein